MSSRAPEIGEVGPHDPALRERIERARREVPFYAKLHAGISTTELSALPTCTKADLVEFGQLPLSAKRLSELYRVSATSGTTGPRLFIGFSEQDWRALRDQYEKIAHSIGLRRDDVLLHTLGGGLWIGAPSLEELAYAARCAVVPAGPTGPAQVFEWLRALPVTLLAATPSYMRLLAESAPAHGIEPGKLALRMGLLGGEGATLALRREICNALGERFVWQELYGSTETGGPILAFGTPEDPFAGRLNVNTEYFVVELLHPDRDEPAPAGEVGEITITTPYREGTPLIRYRTRDLSSACPDSRDASGWPQMTTLVGRIDDALKVRGALVYPSAIEDVLARELLPGAEWRVELERPAGKLDVLRVRFEHPSDELAGPLSEALYRRLQVRPVLTRVPPGTLERFSGKASRVVDRRD